MAATGLSTFRHELLLAILRLFIDSGEKFKPAALGYVNRNLYQMTMRLISTFGHAQKFTNRPSLCPVAQR